MKVYHSNSLKQLEYLSSVIIYVAYLYVFARRVDTPSSKDIRHIDNVSNWHDGEGMCRKYLVCVVMLCSDVAELSTTVPELRLVACILVESPMRNRY